MRRVFTATLSRICSRFVFAGSSPPFRAAAVGRLLGQETEDTFEHLFSSRDQRCAAISCSFGMQKNPHATKDWFPSHQIQFSRRTVAQLPMCCTHNKQLIIRWSHETLGVPTPNDSTSSPSGHDPSVPIGCPSSVRSPGRGHASKTMIRTPHFSLPHSEGLSSADYRPCCVLRDHMVSKTWKGQETLKLIGLQKAQQSNKGQEGLMFFIA
ncbi:hypothetical protein AAFF_G00005880 [Aldrovandia affinis]|uniref:Uncharacterized protein n=1 Tax=Aldrovandia affinis TaxID=143900 RepID=A0AAD7TDR5_9TELE|nr:hypothetical protein AAFF_G00005880 [Aldrovandia affinis]